MALETYTVQIEAEITKFLAGVQTGQAALTALGLSASSVSVGVQKGIDAIAAVGTNLDKQVAKTAAAMNELRKLIEATFLETAAARKVADDEVTEVELANNKRILLAETTLRDIKLAALQDFTVEATLQADAAIANTARVIAAEKEAGFEGLTKAKIVAIQQEQEAVATLAAVKQSAAADAARLANAENNLEIFQAENARQLAEVIKATDADVLAAETAAAAQRTELNNKALSTEAVLTEARVAAAEKITAIEAASAAATAESTAKIAEASSLAATAIQTVFAALDVAAVLLIARGLNDVGNALISVSQSAADTGGQFQLFQSIVKNALDRANEATQGATGTLEQFNATISQTSQLFGAAQIDVAKTTARLLELQPSLGLTGDQLRNVIKTVTVLGVQFKDQGRVLTDFADAFEKLPLPIRRLIGADVTAAATQKELNRILAEGGEQAKQLAGKTEELQRVQAVYNILIRAAAPYVKAFSEQQDNAYLASNRLDAALLDLTNRFGAFTGPTIAAATASLTSLVRAIIALPDFLFASAAAITLFVGASAKIAGSVLEASVVVAGLAGAAVALNAVLAVTIPLLNITAAEALTTFFTKVTGVSIEVYSATTLIRAFALSVVTGLAGATTAVANFLALLSQGSVGIGGLSSAFGLLGPKLLEFGVALLRISGYIAGFALLASAIFEAAKTIGDAAPHVDKFSTRVQLAHDTISDLAAVMQVAKAGTSELTSVLALGVETALVIYIGTLGILVTAFKNAIIYQKVFVASFNPLDFRSLSERVADARKEVEGLTTAERALQGTGKQVIDAMFEQSEKIRILNFNMRDAKDTILLTNTVLVKTTPEVEALGGAFVFTGKAASDLAVHNADLGTAALDAKTKIDIETKALQDQVKAAEGVGKTILAKEQLLNDALILEIGRTAKTRQEAKEQIEAQEVKHALAVVRIHEQTAQTLDDIFKQQAAAEITSSQTAEAQNDKQQKKLVQAASEANGKILALQEQKLQGELKDYLTQLSNLQKFETQRYDEVRANELKIREIHAETADKLFEIQLKENEQTLDGYKESGAEAIDIQEHVDEVLGAAREALANKDYELAQQLTKKAESLAQQLDKVSVDSAGAVADRHRDTLKEVEDINVKALQGLGKASDASAHAAAEASRIIQEKIGEAISKIAAVEEKLRTARETISIEILPEDSKIRAALRDLAATVVTVPIHLDFIGGPGTVFTQVKTDFEQLRKAIESAPPLHIPAAFTDIDIQGGSLHRLLDAADVLKQIITPKTPLFVKVAIANAFLGGADVGGALELTAVPAALVKILTPTAPITIPVAIPNVVIGADNMPLTQAADFIHNSLAAVQTVNIPTAIPAIEIEGQSTPLASAGETLNRVIQPLTPFEVFGKVGIIDPKTGGITFDKTAGKDIVKGLFGEIPPFDVPLQTGTYELKGVGTFTIGEGGTAIKDALTPKEPITVPVAIAPEADVPGGSLHPLSEVGSVLKGILSPKEPINIPLHLDKSQIDAGIASLQNLGLVGNQANEVMNALSSGGIAAAITALEQFGLSEQNATQVAQQLSAALQEQGQAATSAAADMDSLTAAADRADKAAITAIADIEKTLKGGGVVETNTTAGLNEVLRVQHQIALAQQVIQLSKEKADQAARDEYELAEKHLNVEAKTAREYIDQIELLKVRLRQQLNQNELEFRIKNIQIFGGSLHTLPEAGGVVHDILFSGFAQADAAKPLTPKLTTDARPIYTEFIRLYNYIASQTIPVRLSVEKINIPGGSLHTLPEAADVIAKIISPGMIPAQLELLKAQLPQVPRATLPGGGGAAGSERRVTVDLRLNDTSYPVQVADEKSAQTLVTFAQQLRTATRTRGDFVSPYER